MDAKCTDAQWFGGSRSGGTVPSSDSMGYHSVTGGQQQQFLDDEDDDELASILLPDLHGSSDILEEKHVRELSKCLPARAEGYAWTLAFTTTTMGFSLKSLYRSLSRYEGPVLLIIKDNEHSIFGAFSSCSLKPSESFYGTGETYLFTFKQPKQSITQSAPATVGATSATNIPSTTTGGGSTTISSTVIDVTTTTIKSNNQQSNSNIINNNNNNNNNNISGSSAIVSEQKRHYFKRFPWTGDNLYFIKGDTDSLAFGAGEGNFGLWLDEDLYHGSTHSCKTFNNAPLAHHEDFVVCTLECWCFL